MSGHILSSIISGAYKRIIQQLTWEFKTSLEKIDMILDLICYGGFEAYKKFKQVLKETRHDNTLLMKMKEKEDEIIIEMGMYLIFVPPM